MKIPSRILVRWSFAAVALASSVVRGDTAPEPTMWDFSVKTGVTMGTVTQKELNVTGSEAEELELPYGGTPFALSLNQDISRGMSLNVEAHFVADFTSGQLTEKGLHL